jgi:uncharacterized membrane protein YqaE (UPF0057 family)
MRAWQGHHPTELHHIDHQRSMRSQLWRLRNPDLITSISTTTQQFRAITNGTLHSDICKIILAIILPPLGVFLERGCGADLLINILLTILGYIPGIIHALYVFLRP